MSIPLFLPFLKYPQLISMGLNPLDASTWVEPDELLPQYFDNKCRLYTLDRHRVFAETQGSRAAQEEFATRMLTYLCEQHPAIYQREGDELAIAGLPDRLAIGGAEAPLLRVGFCLQDDVCLLQEKAGRHVLIAATLCAPSSWHLQEKMGRPITAIHDPVPRLNERLGKQVEHVLARLTALRPMQRFNWTVTDCNRLAKVDDLAEHSVALANSDAGLYLRVERQALVRLPRSNAIAFTIRVYIYALEALLSVDGALAGLKAAVDGLSPEEVQYKSLLPVYQRLREFTRAQGAA